MNRSSALTLDFEHLPTEAAACDACLERVQDRLRLVGGVRAVEVMRDRRKVRLDLAESADAERIERRARDIMSDIASGFGHESLRVGGMDCPDCANTIERGLSNAEGVLSCRVDFPTARMTVEFDRSRMDTAQIQREVRRLGFSAQPVYSVEIETASGETWTLAIGALLWIGALFIGEWPYVQAALFAAAGFVSGRRMVWAGLNSLLRANFTTNALMTVAIVGAAAIGELLEASAVAWLFALGNTLQSRANRRTRSAVKSLMDAAPNIARRRKDGATEDVDVLLIRSGDLIEVMPHSPVPVDGTVVEGQTTVNNSILTGESEPLFATAGTKVLAGGMNEAGFIVIRADRAFADTTYAKTLELIEQGQTARSPHQELIERFSAWYTPLVISAAALYAVAVPLLNLRPWDVALHQAFWLLMVSCPCALVISIPVAVVTAIGSASRFGALVKGGRHLEALAEVRHWIFDKTGTLTHSRLEVAEISTYEGLSEAEALRLAGALAERSGHPIS
ncbi:MAG: cation-translocating P-type ATPase, partial [Armatimonadetes bacterium]|nr:cation-translocating P-type ATPase [Armatimonadota bacterium]